MNQPKKPRPPQLGQDASSKVKSYNVALDDETDAKARKIGFGERSRGLRRAVRAYVLKPGEGDE